MCAKATAQTGVISQLQRVGSALNLNKGCRTMGAKCVKSTGDAGYQVPYCEGPGGALSQHAEGLTEVLHVSADGGDSH